MSASTEKKNRKAAREAGTDKKTIAAQEEAKQQAKSRTRWILTGIAIVLLIAFIFFINSNFFVTHTTALTIGDRSFSPAEVNYYYGNAYYNFVNTYGSYASIFGLNTSYGISGLDSQTCTMLENGTWKDYFLQQAESNMVQIQALVDYANANGITLTAEEIAEQVDAGFEGIDDYAKSQGYANANGLLAASYGSGVTLSIARQAALDNALASKAMTQVQESFQFTDEELAEYYASLEGSADYFDYAYYYVAAESVENETTNEDGETVTTTEPNDQTRAEAKATADAIVAAYKDGKDIKDILERFEVAVDSQVEGAVPQELSRVTGSNLSAAFLEWMMGNRKAGDITTIEDSSTNGWFVMLFQNRDDNSGKTANVRHILIRAEADENGEYTEEALAAAKARAEEILAEYEAGEQTEEAFAALAEQYSEDSGSNTNGGLYESIMPGEMVEEFDAFCFEGHKSGDTAIVYGTNGAYAGYHVMYYVSDGDTARNVIARQALTAEAAEEWLESVLEGYEAVPGSGYKRVGK